MSDPVDIMKYTGVEIEKIYSLGKNIEAGSIYSIELMTSENIFLEEMLHVQLAANLCLALDTAPNFKPPQYGSEIPYICPYNPDTGECGFLNASLGPLDDTTLNTMLDIETPEQTQLRQDLDQPA